MRILRESKANVKTSLTEDYHMVMFGAMPKFYQRLSMREERTSTIHSGRGNLFA